MNLSKVCRIGTGISGSYGRVCLFDSDRDSAVELHFNSPRPGLWSVIRFYSYRPWNRLVFVDSLNWPPGSSAWVPWAVGNLDRDSLADMVVEMGCSLAVFESPVDTALPKNAVWKYPYERGSGHSPTFIADLDSDGKHDIYLTYAAMLYIFENDGDNSYRRVLRESVYVGGSPTWMTSGDFDMDGRGEIVMSYECGVGPSVIVYECTGDDSYARTWLDSTVYWNHQDVCGAADADADGKPEFVVSWKRFEGTWRYFFRVYESTGDDQYEAVFWDSIGGVPAGSGQAHSVCGDVDSDGRDEIVWAVGNNWFVYKASGNDLYQCTFAAYPRLGGNQRMSTQVFVCDLNRNGYPEVIESGLVNANLATETLVWEIEGVRLHRPNGGEVLTPGSQFPITWEKFTPPGADSFSLFVSFDNGVNYQTITTIQQSNDTLYLWSVPDTLADSCKLMIWAYGPPRAGQQVPRGTAWDFSDSTFSIRQTGVAEGTGNRAQGIVLRILQNPTTARQGVRLLVTGHAPHAKLQIHDVAGKLVRSFTLGSMSNTPCPVALHLSPGIYFITLQCEGKAVTRKLVVVE